MFTTYAKQFEQTTKQVTEFFTPKQFKEAQEKSKTFALDILNIATEATQSNIEAVSKIGRAHV